MINGIAQHQHYSLLHAKLHIKQVGTHGPPDASQTIAIGNDLI